ncbi:hypothetical protein JN531_001465 [Flagellatimonas centrodinii]|uniref:hypothetical protein n=1 Tax=Flagellatimonas centrodinii TaxID=2806210 RepID=UPI001FED8C10|nr:hypothetical protein [Flagellatimonas centrodinii]ULQ46967.1 hypothetical protein JN531_001465 [Flagellatimonas centrodinii]
MKKIPAVVLVALLSACGGGGDSSDEPGADARGLYEGQFSQSGQTFQLAAVVGSDQRAFLLSLDAGALYAGQINTAATSLSGALTAYEITSGSDFSLVAERAGISTITGIVTPMSGISGNYSTSFGPPGTFALTYDERSGDAPSLASISGVYSSQDPISGFSMSASVDIDGSLTASDSDGCNYTGAISIPDSTLNLYDAAVTGSCPGQAAETLTGFVVSTDPASASGLLILLANNALAVAAFLAEAPTQP